MSFWRVMGLGLGVWIVLDLLLIGGWCVFVRRADRRRMPPREWL